MLLTFFVTLSLCLAEVCLQNILQQDSCYNRRWTAQQQQISDLQTLVKQYVVSQQSNQEEPGKFCLLKAKLNKQRHTILWLKWDRLCIYYGWFHLYWLIRAVKNAEKGRIKNEKLLPKAGLEPTISRLLDWRSNRLCYRVILTVGINR